MLQRGPGGFDPFLAIERVFGRDAFSPPHHAIALGGEQEDAAAIDTAKARLKEMDERHLDFAQGNGFNLHVNLELVYPLFVPPAQQEFAISMMIPFVPQN